MNTQAPAPLLTMKADGRTRKPPGLSSRLDGEASSGKPPPGPMRKSFNELWLRVHFALHLWWIWVFHRVRDWLLGSRWSLAATEAVASSRPGAAGGQHRRKVKRILHIGDELAYGTGDWVIPGEVAGLFNHLALPLPTMLRQWEVATLGRPRSSSADWRPDAPPWHHDSAVSRPRVVMAPRRGGTSDGARSSLNLFDECFHATMGRFTDVDVVLITLGLNDTCSPEATTSNVAKLANGIVDSIPGCIVVVSTCLVPPNSLKTPITRVSDSAGSTDERKGGVRRVGFVTDVGAAATSTELTGKKEYRFVGDALKDRADALLRYLRSLDHAGRIRPGPDLSIMKANYLYRFGGRFLSGAGHKFAAKLWSEPVLLACKTIELRDFVDRNER
mgnify:FL=1